MKWLQRTRFQRQTCPSPPKRVTVWELCEFHVPVPEGIQQEFPFSRALSGVLPPTEEEAESWELVTFPSSTPRPCRHTVGRHRTFSCVRSRPHWGGLQQTTKDHLTFLFTAVDDLQIFGDIRARVGLHVGVRKAERTVVAHLPVPGKDAVHRAAPCRTASSPG